MSQPQPHLFLMKQASHFFLVLLLGLLQGLTAARAQVAISGGQAGNVDAGQFHVFWQVDDTGSRPGLDIFSDAAATASLNGELGVEFYPLEMNDVTVGQTAAQRDARRALQALTRAKGIVMAKVTGAQPGTTYHARPRSFDATTGAPDEAALAPLIEVTTPESTAFVVESRQVLVSTGGCFAGSQGLVMRLVKDGAPYPLFAVVGDHEQTDKALFDVNRLLNATGTTNENLAGAPSFELDLIGPAAPLGVFNLDLPFAGEFVVASATEVDFTANFPGLAYFSMEAVGAPLQGVPFDFNITARDADGDVLTTYDGTVELTTGDPGDLVSGAGETANFVNGVLAGHEVVSAVSGPVTFTATRPCGIETGSQVFNFSPPNLDITFSAPLYAVNQGAESVTLTLTRNETLPASVIIHTNNGAANAVNPPFAAALAGTDYLDLDGPTTVVNFAQDEVSKTVTVTLYPMTRSNTPNKRFTATLHPPVAGAALSGAITTADIHILADDVLPPKVTITKPAANTTALSLPQPYTVEGRAGDARGIDRVEVVLNGGAPLLAVLAAGAKSTAIPFTAEIEPAEGPNTLEVTAYDLRGNSTTVTRNFNFTRRYWLTLNRVVPEGFEDTPNLVGSIAMTASDRKLASAPGPRTSATQTSMIVPGTGLTLTAKPMAGYAFSHWTGMPGGAVVVGNALSFVMPASDVPPVTAVFIVNPFLGLGAKADFLGLLHPSDGTDTSNSTVGFLRGTLTTGKGSMSGRVLINGRSQSFVAYVFGNGSVTFKAGTLTHPSLDFDGRSLSMSYHAGALQMQVLAGADESEGQALAAAHDAGNPVAAELLNRPARAGDPVNQGFFTLVLPSKAQEPAMDANTYPQGAGYGTVVLSRAGLVTASGVLADGSKWTGASAIVAGGHAPVFSQILTPGTTTRELGGSMGGLLVFDHTQAESDVTASDLLWLRPAVAETANLATHAYTPGWPSGIVIDGVGALYDAGADVQTSLVLGAPGVDGNARLVLSGGRLTETITKTNFNITASKVAKIPTTDKSFTLSFTQRTGAFSGKFAPNWAAPATAQPKFTGVLLQKGPAPAGFGHFISNAVNDLDPESGAVFVGSPE